MEWLGSWTRGAVLHPAPFLSSSGGMVCLCISLVTRPVTAWDGDSELCEPWGDLGVSVSTGHCLGLAAFACCLLQPLPQGKSLGQRAGYQLDILAQLVVSADLSVWFGSLSWPPSQRSLSLTRRTISDHRPTSRAQGPGNNQSPQ